MEIYNVRVKRCGKCFCGFMSTSGEKDKDITLKPSLLNPPDELVDRADLRIGKSVVLVRDFRYESILGEH